MFLGIEDEPIKKEEPNTNKQGPKLMDENIEQADDPQWGIEELDLPEDNQQ